VTTALARIAGLIHQQTGIVLSPAQEATLLAAMGRAARGLSPDAFLDAISDPAGGAELMARLVDEVTVQETTFVRDRAQLDSIAWPELHERALASGSATIRVWSAGCATGEEPYTLALLATEAFAPAGPPVDVLGTDISRAALAAAAVGRYRERAVRGLGAAVRQRHFEWQADSTFVVGPQLRALVRLRLHNLARDPYPPPGEARFDLVVCRNVLIYFPPPLAGRVIESLAHSLRPGGMLLLGAADALQRTIGPPAPCRRGAGRGDRRAIAERTSAPRQPVTRSPVRSREKTLAAALAAADRGDRGQAAGQVDLLLADDPLDADAHFIRGLVALDAGDPVRAVAALRRALYADASFALAAFTLGRAYNDLGDTAAAQRAYRQALGLLDPDDHRHELMLQQVDIGDIAAACRARLGG
jgi:chemotaxis protein methyltransferase CheR